MFKKFSVEENVVSRCQAKSSVGRGIKKGIVEQYPSLEEVIDDIFPKKEPVVVFKCNDHVQIIAYGDTPLFYNERDGSFFPTLRLLHKYPDMMHKVQVDRGAIKFVLSGANIMCPGLTSPGGKLDEELEANTPVAIYAEGKVHACAVGYTVMSIADIKSVNKGIAINTVHYLNDGLWKCQALN